MVKKKTSLVRLTVSTCENIDPFLDHGVNKETPKKTQIRNPLFAEKISVEGVFGRFEEGCQGPS